MCDVTHVDTVVRFISLPSDRFLCNAACEKNRSALCGHSFHVPDEIFPQAASIVCFALSALLICCLLPTFLLTYHHIFTTCMIELLPFSDGVPFPILFHIQEANMHVTEFSCCGTHRYVKKDCLRCTEIRKEFP